MLSVLLTVREIFLPVTLVREVTMKVGTQLLQPGKLREDYQSRGRLLTGYTGLCKTPHRRHSYNDRSKINTSSIPLVLLSFTCTVDTLSTLNSEDSVIFRLIQVFRQYGENKLLFPVGS